MPRKEGSGPTIIGHMNVVPKCIENSKYPQFESIQQTIGDANATLKENPIPGICICFHGELLYLCIIQALNIFINHYYCFYLFFIRYIS